jgi:hypothetical protein
VLRRGVGRGAEEGVEEREEVGEGLACAGGGADDEVVGEQAGGRQGEGGKARDWMGEGLVKPCFLMVAKMSGKLWKASSKVVTGFMNGLVSSSLKFLTSILLFIFLWRATSSSPLVVTSLCS